MWLQIMHKVILQTSEGWLVLIDRYLTVFHMLELLSHAALCVMPIGFSWNISSLISVCVRMVHSLIVIITLTIFIKELLQPYADSLNNQFD